MSDLHDLAAEIVTHLREHFPDSDERLRQTLALTEEAGEFAEAYLIWSADPPWASPHWLDVVNELADVVITAHVTAVVLGIDLADVSTAEPADAFSPWRHVMAVPVEAGRFVGAYRRWAGMARRPGRWADVEEAFRAVVASAWTASDALGIDLHAAWRVKAEEIFTRGWRDKSAEVTR